MDHAAPIDPLAHTLARKLEPYRRLRRWWIACSGGVDSVALLHAVVALTRSGGEWPSLAAIHVNHQLNPQAASWARHVEALCGQWAVPCSVVRIDVGDTAALGVEAAARQQRYTAFAAAVQADELLLQAHHRDDQIETLLLRLLRGSGAKGLRGIPVSRAVGGGILLRPWLDNTRDEILLYARGHGLAWVDDDSNDDVRYDRNFLRQRVLPLIGERWPAYRDTLQRAIVHSAEADALLDEIAAADWRALDDGAEGLGLERLATLSPLRQRQVLRFWLARCGLSTPSRAQLEQILALTVAAPDTEPCVAWPGAEVRRFRSRLYAMTPLADAAPFDLAWTPPAALALPGGSALEAVPLSGGGLRADRTYRVCSRRGGERCHPATRAHSQTLKKLLQEHALAPWWRERVPLVYCGDELAAVGDLWICRGYEASARMPGWRLFWRRAAE